MKKILSGLLVFILVVTLTACASESKTTETTVAQTEVETTADHDHDKDDHDHDKDAEGEKEHEHDEQADHDHDHEHNHVDIATFIPNFDDIKAEFGVEVAPKSVLAFSWVDNMYLIEADAPIVALPDNHHLDDTLLSQFQKFTDHDGKIDYAMIKDLKPELVFVSQEALDKDEELKSTLAETGSKIVEMPKASTYDEVLHNVGKLAALFGTEEGATTNLDVLIHRMMEAKESVENKVGTKVTVLTVTGDGEFVLGKDGFVNSLLEELELSNAMATVKLEGEADRFGNFKSPGLEEIKNAGTQAMVVMVRIRDKEEKAKAIEKLESEIKTVFGEKFSYEIVDHHGVIIAYPGAIAGLENIADIVSSQEL